MFRVVTFSVAQITQAIEKLLQHTLKEMKMAFFEITTNAKCPNRCMYCPQDLFLEKYSGRKFLSFESFKVCLDKLPSIDTVVFSGFSEPFFNPETADMIQYASAKGHSIWVFTTLVGLDIESYCKIKDISFGHFWVHLPDADNKTQIPMTNKYIEALKYLAMNPPQGNFRFTHHGSAVHPSIKGLNSYSLQCTINDRAGNLTDSGVQSVSNTGTIKCGHQFILNHTDGAGVLLPNGDVYLCCMDFGLTHKLGNLLTQTWGEILHSAEMKRVLNGLTQENIHILCRKCVYALKANPSELPKEQ